MKYEDSGSKQLTVVVLTYNSELTINACLDALVAQKRAGFKVLVVDDDSTDRTLELVESYSRVLDIGVAKNGSHNIAKGRNIGLRTSGTKFVAFVDSDDSATTNWTDVILRTFENEPTLSLISGDLQPMTSTRTSRAIAANDDTVRRLFANNVYLFSSCNCALNKTAILDNTFDEHFRYAEDIEFAARIDSITKWKYIPDMKVSHTSRSSFRRYAVQMYDYGSWRMYYGVRTNDFRLIDFIPLSVILASMMGAVLLKQPLLLLGIVAFSLVESVVVVLYRRLPLSIAVLVPPAWLTKNVAWSLGVVRAGLTLSLDKRFRGELRDSARPR